MVQTTDTALWTLALKRQHIDPNDLAAAVEDQVVRQDLDYRSRLLIRDSVQALQHYWGAERVETWLRECPVGWEIEDICSQEFEDDRGFPSLRYRVMEPTRPEEIRQFFRELGEHLQRPARVALGGSGSLILQGYLSRRTEDLDVVDELPPDVRSQRVFIETLEQRYGLQLAHFQSHYLPAGWDQRVHTLAAFGRLNVALVDVYDVFLSKLFSGRDKDRDDLRALAPQLDKEILIHKLKASTQSMLVVPSLRDKAEKNWNVLYGEPLPT